MLTSKPRTFLSLAFLLAAALLAQGCDGGPAAPQADRPRAAAPPETPAVDIETLNVAHLGALGNGTTDDTTAIVAALAACKPGRSVFFPKGVYPISQTLYVPTGCIVRGDGGGLGEGAGTLGGVKLLWVGVANQAVVRLHDVGHSAFEGINLEADNVPGMIGIWYDSDDHPTSSFNAIRNLTIKGMHQAIVAGLPDDSTVVCPGAPPYPPGCDQADTLTLENFNIYGDPNDPNGEGIHVNSANALQNSEIRIGNIQAVNIGIHTVQTNGIYAVRNVNGGSAVGTNPTFMQNDPAAIPPDLYEVESEGAWTYGIHDSSCGGSGHKVQTWVGVNFNTKNDQTNPNLLDGCATIVSVGTSGGFYTVTNQVTVLELGGDPYEWTASNGGQIYHLPGAPDHENLPRLGLGGNQSPAVGIYLSGSPMTGARQYGVDVNTTFSGDAGAYGFGFAPATAPSVNVPEMVGYYVGSANHGVPGGVGNYYGFYCTSMEGASSSWCLYSDSKVPSYLGGSLTAAGGIETSAVKAGIVQTGATGNTDLAGQLTLASGTATQAFTRTYPLAPACIATDTTAPNPVQIAVGASSLTVTGTGNDVVDYVCVVRQ